MWHEMRPYSRIIIREKEPFGPFLHRRPDSKFLSRSLFTIFEINPIIILMGYTNSNTDIDTEIQFRFKIIKIFGTKVK